MRLAGKWKTASLEEHMRQYRSYILSLQLLLTLLMTGLADSMAQTFLPDTLAETKPLKKLSQALQQRSKLDGAVLIYVQYNQADSLLRWFADKPVQMLAHDTSWKVMTLQMPAYLLISLSKQPSVQFIQAANRRAKPELSVPGFDPSANGIALAATRFASSNGTGIRVAIKEERFDTLDIDFSQRFFTTARTATRSTNHASIMASMLAGSGASSITGKGVAPAATITSTNFDVLIPEPLDFYNTNKISIQNHSYGVGIENEYGIDAAAYDASTAALPYLLHVFSAGNSGTQSSAYGQYQGIANWANLTGSFKISKNSLVLAATDSFNKREIASSRGPAYDGRIKPELSAFGEDGSSGSAALAAGAVAVLQQSIQQQLGSLPDAALVKAILINSSTDVGAEGPDFSEGYGQLNVYNALRIAAGKQYYTGTILAGDTVRMKIPVATNAQRLAVTLCWTDPAATPGSTKALQNDLQLMLRQPNQQVVHPWILNSAAHADSLQQPATRGIDSLNVVEHISLLQPATGEYEAMIVAPTNVSGTQTFALAWHSNSNNELEFTHPTNTYHADSRNGVTIRWEHSFPQGQTGVLSVKNLATQNTSLINNNIALDSRLLVWRPAANAVYPAQLQLQVGQQVLLSDSFWVHKGLQPRIGYVCGDTLLLYWQHIALASSYRIYHVQNGQMQVLSTTADTLFRIRRSSLEKDWLAVAPVFGNQQGNRSYAINYLNQQVGCYIQQFTATAGNNNVLLQVQLGTNFGIQQLQFEKVKNGQVTVLSSIANISSNNFTAEDAQPLSGENYYRIKITLSNGNVVYSAIETVYMPESNGLAVYPNPVLLGQPIRIINTMSGEFPIAELYDFTGRKISSTQLESFINTINTAYLHRGIYLLKLTQAGKTISVKKITVL
ncbi:MAG: S8 family peptidase [Bacteroidetes bacterium]|uniref:S8 family peptidase n=1 Tax=Phnomibacter sp. TaxID=2836217 RepID=UPI002FDCCBC0|nr:S8 family peptidase [Bacteroidota bacterium]